MKKFCMKILIVHNFHGGAAPSGETQAVKAEIKLLREGGHKVFELTRRTDQLSKMSLAKKVFAYSGMFLNLTSYLKVRKILKEHNPDIMHVHNTFPLISNSVFWAAKGKIPVIQTLHNYKKSCASGIHFRKSMKCYKCRQPNNLHALFYSCYHGSLWKTTILLLVSTFNQIMHKIYNDIDAYIYLSSSQLDIISKTNLNLEVKYFHKPNFVFMTEDNMLDKNVKRHGVLFLGRLTEEKGILHLIEHWSQNPSYPNLIIAGDGPLKNKVECKSRNSKNIQYLGMISHNSTKNLLMKADYIIVPSLWDEPFGMVTLEGLTHGAIPLVTSNGAGREIIEDSITGFTFDFNDKILTEKFKKIFSMTEQQKRDMRRIGRAVVLKKYSASINLRTLINIYTDVVKNHASKT